jgi:uncharacterized membrane protein YeaQ/YmgE (transglycosylase-associated protein family)
MINVLVWLLFGIAAGLAAGWVAKPAGGDAPLLNITAGMLGAVVGGVVFLIFDTTPLSAFNAWGMVMALLGAVVLIGLARIVTGRPI